MKKKKQPVDDYTFGEVYETFLSEIEDAILERKLCFPEERPLYPDEAIRAAMTIFTDVIVDRAFRYWISLGLTADQMIDNAIKFGDELRLLVFRYADYDTRIK